MSEIIPNQITITVTDEVSADEIISTVLKHNCKIIKHLPIIKVYVISTPSGQENEAIEALKKEPFVTSAQSNRIRNL